MKTFAIASVIALASVASAQFDAIPQCALTCFVGPLGSDGCSQLTDFKCHCQKGSSLVSAVTPCVQKSCQAADQAATLAGVEKICKDNGVPLDLPSVSSLVPGVSSALASATSAAASAASSAASSAGGAASSAVSSAASAASSAASAASSLASKASSGMASATGGASGSAKPSTSPTQFTGGAPQATAVGILGAAAIAMLAL